VAEPVFAALKVTWTRSLAAGVNVGLVEQEYAFDEFVVVQVSGALS
jgi:hypothetical protein